MATVTGIAPGATGVADSEAGRGDGADRTRDGALRVAAVFSDHMVLQRGRPIAIFGEAPANARVIVGLVDAQGVAVAETMAVAANTSRDPRTPCAPWLAILPAFDAGGPYTLIVSHETDCLKFTDVMIGEVWVAGGQSNIELELHTSEGGAEAVGRAHDPLLRFYNTPKTGRIDEAAEARSGWEPALAPQVAHMSAVAYHFGARLRERLGGDVAVGVIDCYIGGTSITCWMSSATLAASAAGRPYVERYAHAIAGKSEEQMRREADEWQAVFDRWNDDVAAMKRERPGVTQPQIDAELGPCPWPPPVTPFSERRLSAAYEAMVRRIAPFSVAGVLWYQGEEDEEQCASYRELLGLLIDEWRTLWNLAGYDEPLVGYQPCGSDPLPFLLVQLPQWIDGQVAASGEDPRHWPVIRDAQFDAAETIDDVDVICTMDCGEFDNIHPLDKRTVGERLAEMALRTAYGRLDAKAPSPRMADVRAADGAMLVRFADARGLHWRGTTPDTMRGATDDAGDARGAATSGFEVAGADGVFVAADARIAADGADGAVVEVRADAVPEPRAVRYAWRSWGPAPLFNADELPAFPFTA